MHRTRFCKLLIMKDVFQHAYGSVKNIRVELLAKRVCEHIVLNAKR
jgi:hypothetical protein